MVNKSNEERRKDGGMEERGEREGNRVERRKDGGKRKENKREKGECVSVRRLGCRDHTDSPQRRERIEERPCHPSLLTLHFIFYSFHSSYL